MGEKGLVAVGSHVESGFVGEAARSVLYRHRKGSVLLSTDRGKTWEALDAGNPAGSLLTDVDFLDEKHGCVVGENGFLAKTADGGKTWTTWKTGTTVRLNAVDLVDAITVYAVGEKGTAIGTNDGGKTVVALKTGTAAPLRDCSFTSEQAGFAVGRGGLVLRFVRDY